MVLNKGTLLWIVHEGNYSGANMALVEYFEVLIEMGYQIKVVSPAKGTFVDALRKANISIVVLPMYPWTRPLDKGFFFNNWTKRLLRNSFATLQIAILALKAKAVCTNTICIVSGALAAKLINKPHYWFVHEFGEEDHGFRLALGQRKAYKWMYRLSKKVVLNSLAVKEKWEQVLCTDAKLSLLYNIVKSPPSEQTNTPIVNNQHFLMLGQISPGKGHLTAISAIQYLKNQYPGIQLDIIGSTPSPEYIQQLHAKIDKINAREYIHIKPAVKNPHLLFKQYRALLMCSRMEAFGRVTVEAMKAGLPVIAANYGGTKEIIINEFNGFLFNSDKPDSLNAAIEKIINIEEKGYNTLKENALNITKKFNAEVSKSQFDQILEY